MTNIYYSWKKPFIWVLRFHTLCIVLYNINSRGRNRSLVDVNGQHLKQWTWRGITTKGEIVTEVYNAGLLGKYMKILKQKNLFISAILLNRLRYQFFELPSCFGVLASPDFHIFLNEHNFRRKFSPKLEIFTGKNSDQENCCFRGFCCKKNGL